MSYRLLDLGRGVHTKVWDKHPPAHNYPGHRPFVEIFSNGQTWKYPCKSPMKYAATDLGRTAVLKWAAKHRPEWIEALEAKTHILAHGIFNQDRDGWFLLSTTHLDPLNKVLLTEGLEGLNRVR